MNQFCTYLHCRPDGIPFYVGKGLPRRAKELHHGRNKYYRNIVAKYGVTNIIVQITAHNLTEEEAHSHECFLIDHFRRLGYQLTNMTDGGEGASGHKHSTESIAKMSAALKGNKHCVGRIPSPEHRAKISVLSKGKKLSLEQRAQISARRKGKANNLGFKHTEESIAKIRASKLGRKASAETRAKMSLQRHSADNRSKISASLKSHWDKKKREMKTLLGRIFTDWTVFEYIGRDKNNHSRWWCRCVCGNVRSVLEGNLLRGISKSCGCKRKQITSDNFKRRWQNEEFAQQARVAMSRAWTPERRARLAQWNRNRAKRFIAPISDLFQEEYDNRIT